MLFENIRVFNFCGAIRGMRNPMNSWAKSDSHSWNFENGGESFIMGNNDLKLAQNLIKAGPEHRKFLRQIFVSYDLTAPLYFWKEFDTYKVSTVANSTSTMHKLSSTPITLDCFETSDYNPGLKITMPIGESKTSIFAEDLLIPYLEQLRQMYVKTQDKKYWKELVRWLPNGWLQKRTITMDYETLLSIVKQRKNHKLTEWSVDFMNFIKDLPYAKELLFYEEG